ncbi:MAG: lysophospholipid acyltransferase family protein [Acidobacteriota bacterium]
MQYWLACSLVNAYPLPQTMTGVRRSLRFTGELVEAGYCPLVYPEGERSRDGGLRPFKPGIGLMAVRLKVPVVPVHLEGMFQILSMHDSWPKTGAVRMRVGAPLRFEGDRDYEEATQEVEKAVRELGLP